MPSVIKTEILVKAALSGQKDSAGVSKYEHCLRVARNAVNLCYSLGLWEDQKFLNNVELIALLHDTLEDSDLTADDLHVFGFSNTIIDAVELVTHEEDGGTYQEYIDRLCASGNLLALVVKLADNLDNTSAERTEKLEPKFKAYLENRYAGVKTKLFETINNLIHKDK